MSNKQDLLLRLDSQFNDQGFKNAESSAKVLERELAKQEAAERQLANLQMAAFREDQNRRAAQLTSMTALGKGFTAVGLLAAAGLGLAGKAAIDWQSAWTGVTKTADGSKEEVAALEEQLRGLARSLPATHEEIAGVAEAAGQLGVKARDIAGFTKTMIDLGVSTNLSAEDAATGLAQLGNIMGVLPSQADRAGAALVALGNDGASTEADILAMSLRIAGAGKTIGLSEAQVMGYANALTSMGIDAEAGGSAISRVMIDIAQAVDTGGDKLDQFAQVAGMSSEQFTTAFRKDAAGAVASFVTGLGRMQKQGQSTFGVLNDLGLSEIRVRDTLLRASNAGSLLTDSIKLGSQAWEENIALLNEANKRYETADSRIKIARNQLNDAAIDIGANVLPAISGAAGRVGFLAEAFHALPDGVKTAVVILGGVVATVGLLGGATLMLIPKLAAMNATLAASGPAGAAAARGLSAAGSAMLGPWGLALAGATTLLGIFAEKQFEAKQKADEFKATLDQSTGALTDASKAYVANELLTNGLAENYGNLVGGLKNLTEAALGNEEVLTRLHGEQKANEDTITRLAAKHGDLTDAEYAELDAATQRSEAYQGLFNRLKPLTGEYSAQIDKQKQLGSVTEDATGSTQTFTKAQQESKAATEQAKKELDDLIKSIEHYGDTTNNALDATSAYEAAIDDAAAALKENGKTANKARTEIDLHTKAGRANDKALREIASTALKAATANFENGKSVKTVTDNVMKARDEFVSMAQKMGLNETAANKLADQLGLTTGNVGQLNSEINKTPAKKATDFEVRTKKALEELAAFQYAIDKLHGKSVTATVRYVRTGESPTGGHSTAGGSTFDAMGSIHEFAAGGFAPVGGMQPQIRLAGGEGMTWAEKGAGPWEAFISGNPANHDRSEALWWETGRRLGTLDRLQPQVVPIVVKEGHSLTFAPVYQGSDGQHDARRAQREWEFRVVNRL